MFKTFILIILFALVPSLALAQDGLLPAVCKQVLEPSKDTTVPDVIKDYLVKKTEELPKAIVKGAENRADALAQSLSKKVESTPEPKILGDSSTVNNLYKKALSGSSFLLKHYLWTLGGLALASVFMLI